MLFSVIVPIYNVEKYLRRCIDSILSQNFKDFELILVDDGSPDNCPHICDEYKEKDTRIRVVHKENGGLVSARKAGMAIAEGEYIFNIDSDDALNEGVLEKTAEIINETGAEIVSFSYDKYTEKTGDRETVHDLVAEGLYEKDDIKRDILPRTITDRNMQHLFYFSWGRAIKKSIAYKNQMAISEKITMGEDVSMMVSCFAEAEKVYFCRMPGCIYTVRGDSISWSFKPDHFNQISETIKHLEKYESVLCGQLPRYSAFMCLAILASAAEGGFFSKLPEIKELILASNHHELIKKAEFDKISVKSRICFAFLKKDMIKTAFYFLYFCKLIKNILKKG